MRVKGGPQGHRRHKKILKITKGQRGTKHRLFRRANEAMLKSLWYATRDRKVRKRDLRKLWIARINAAARLNGTTTANWWQHSRTQTSSLTARCWPIWQSATRKHLRQWSQRPNNKSIARSGLSPDRAFYFNGGKITK